MRKQQQETRERTNKNIQEGKEVGIYCRPICHLCHESSHLNPISLNLSVCPQWLQPPGVTVCLTGVTHYLHRRVSVCLGSKKPSKFTSPSLIQFEIPLFFLLPSFTLQPSDNKGGSCWSPSRQVITSLMDGDSEGKGANTVREQREGSEEVQVIEVRKNKKRNWGFFLAHK